jgi:hypothetical protein
MPTTTFVGPSAGSAGDGSPTMLPERPADGVSAPSHATSAPTIFVRATLVPPRAAGRGVVARASWLSPYAVETITADARRGGPGTRLELTVPASAPLGAALRVERLFAPLAALGVTVDVQHDHVRRGRFVA